ncbi:MAG TPA: LPS export ABC transporter ATP-binding protein [Candidatus Methylacidiphilales bacterium]|nr:LPS export ABC transporter ATP-binding protein [Candidatus Methylacidiphilales bacterium]
MKHRLPKPKSITTRSESPSGMEQTELLMGESKPGSTSDSKRSHRHPPPTVPENEIPAAGQPKSPASTDGALPALADRTSPAEGKENGQTAPGETPSRQATPPLSEPNSQPFYIPEMKAVPAGPEPASTGERFSISDTVPMPALTEEKPAVIEPLSEMDTTKKPPDPVAEKVLLPSPAVAETNHVTPESAFTGGKRALFLMLSSALSLFRRLPEARRDPATVSASSAASETVPAPSRPPLLTPRLLTPKNGQIDHGVPLIQTQGLVKQYGGRRVVNGVDIHVRAGEVVGLLGKNGAGKTTTFYMIVGLVPPTLGHVFMGDEDVTHMPMYRRARRGIGYLPQEESIFRKLTVEENLLAILETLPMTEDEREIRCDELLKDFGLEHVRENVAITLSGGEKRRVTIARALVTSPSLLLLDEPFSGVDPMAVHDIQEIILHLKERGLGVLITDHNVRETLSVVDRAYIIDEGRVLSEGTREFLLNDPIAREIYLGHRFSM